MNERVLSGFEIVRFRVCEERTAWEEKMKEKCANQNEQTGLLTLLYKLLDRVDPNPVHSPLMLTV